MYRFILYFSLCVLLLAVSNFSASVILFFLLGYLTWLLTEYLFHRFVFHHYSYAKKAIAYDHLMHHKDPTSLTDLFLPFKLTIPISTILFLVVLSFFNFSAASYFYSGLFLGYFGYEFIHHQIHHGSLKLFSGLRKYHLYHHQKAPRKHFGVSNPLFDLIFGTY